MKVTRFRQTVTGLATAGLLAVTVLAAPAASAASVSSTKWCNSPTPFGWLTVTTTGYTTIDPPGSAYVYKYSTGGERTRVAAYANGAPKPNGGYWIATGTQAYNANAFCTAGAY